MIPKEHIDRLGFDAWAANVFQNAIEDYYADMGGNGNVSMESKDMNMNMTWDDKTIEFNLRAYTHEGWKEYTSQIKK
jgi:hypothetical protein